MPIGKIAASLLENPVMKSVVEPINAGMTGFGVASGDTSIGESLAGTTAGVGAFHYARKGTLAGVANLGAKATNSASHFVRAAGRALSPRMGEASKSFNPLYRGKGMNLGMVPGKLGTTLGVVGGTLGAMAIAPAAVALARKYVPIWKRKAPTGQLA